MEGMKNIAMLALEVYGSSLIKKGISKTKQVGSEILESTGKQLDDVPSVSSVIPETTPTIKDKITPDSFSGIKQQAKELGERFPRAIEKGKQASQEASERASRIDSSSPAVANAIKVKLDDRIITTVADADAVTLKAYKEMVDIAGNTSKKLGSKERPEIVAGKAAEKQFNVVNAQRKVVGEQIGALADDLSKTTKIDMKESFNSLKGTLGRAGIVEGPNGKLIIEPLKYTPSQEKLIRDLYKLAKKGGDELSPSQIHSADRLFSTLQREANVEQISNVMLKTAEGDKNMFQVFRDVFSKKLDEVSPEIKELNSEYRVLKVMVDDVANSIAKSGGKFETTKGVSNAEFAQTNLRRMLSDAQSATSYREIARQLDSMSRTLGYKGATPEDLITFATEMRKLYPDVIPPTSFTGGIRTGLKSGATDIAEKVLRAGKPDLADQQKALKGLLDELLNPPKKGSPAVGKTANLSMNKGAVKKIDAPKEFIEKQISLMRAGEREVIENFINFDKVARERFDISKLEKISFGGSDRDVYKIGDNKALKVSKTARGLAQNASEGELYAPVPKVFETGDNYVITELAGKPNAKTKEFVKKMEEFKDFNSRMPEIDMLQKTQQYFIDKGDDKLAEIAGDFMNYDVMINDITSIRNWGTIDGSPVLLDAGSLNKHLLDDYKGIKNLNDTEFYSSYIKSKEAKKKFGDIDKKTMYGIGGLLLLTQQ